MSIYLQFFLAPSSDLGFFFCFLWYFVSHDSQTSNSTGCAATTNRQVIYFLKKKPTEMGQQGANESLLRPLEVRKVWHWAVTVESRISTPFKHVAGCLLLLLLLFQIADTTPTPHQEASRGLQLLHQPLPIRRVGR